MLTCVKESSTTNNTPSSSHLVYTLILHKLANLGGNKKKSSSESNSASAATGVQLAQAAEPGVQLALLQALPALAAERSCVQQLLRLGECVPTCRARVPEFKKVKWGRGA
jgi:hypothetical protein